MMIGDAELALPHYDGWAAVDALQVLDEEGIPVVSAISRTSSGCILDAPGAVQVRLHVHLDLKVRLPACTQHETSITTTCSCSTCSGLALIMVFVECARSCFATSWDKPTFLLGKMRSPLGLKLSSR